MVSLMNATAQASAARVSGPKLDNRRVLAALVDLAIVVAGTLVILFAADALSGDRGDVRGALSAVILGWALYYYFALESGDGQTVGKKLLKLRVMRADGQPAGMREIAVRTVLRVVDGIGGYIVGLIVMLATGQRRQRLGDLAAGTIVVDASGPAYAPPAPVAKPVEEASVEEQPDVEESAEAEAEASSYTDTSTITLPSRPRPATLEDLTAPEAPEGREEPAVPAVPEMRPFDPPPVQDEPVAEVEVEPAVEDEPVAEDVAEPVPVVEVEVVEVEDVEDEPVAVEPEAEPEPEVEDVEDEAGNVEPMTVKSVETVSAIDLVMGGASEEDASSEPDQDPEPPLAS
jgi:uncharacterized RDD family membrane protein YckC